VHECRREEAEEGARIRRGGDVLEPRCSHSSWVPQEAAHVQGGKMAMLHWLVDAVGHGQEGCRMTWWVVWLTQILYDPQRWTVHRLCPLFGCSITNPPCHLTGVADRFSQRPRRGVPFP